MSDDTTSYDNNNNNNNGGHQNDPFMTHIKGKTKFRCYGYILLRFSFVSNQKNHTLNLHNFAQKKSQIIKIMRINEN